LDLLLGVDKIDVYNNTYYVENGALLRNIARLWKMILGGHGKLWKSNGKFLWKKRAGTCNSSSGLSV